MTEHHEETFDIAGQLADVRAPDRLHNAVAEMTPAPRPSRRLHIAGAAVAAACVMALALVLVAPFDDSPTVDQAATAATAGPTAGAPTARADGTLNAAVGSVAFPDWKKIHPTGMRTTEVDGRSMTTVYYAAPGGGEIRYTIVDGAPIDNVQGGSYDVTGSGDARRIVWRRDGHTCIVEAEGVPSAKLESALGLS
jgi:hypothetical protein